MTFDGLLVANQDLCLGPACLLDVLGVGELPGLAFNEFEEPVLLRALLLADHDRGVLESEEPARRDKVFDQAAPVSVDVLLAFVHAAQALQPLGLSVLLGLRVDTLDVDLFHSQIQYRRDLTVLNAAFATGRLFEQVLGRDAAESVVHRLARWSSKGSISGRRIGQVLASGLERGLYVFFGLLEFVNLVVGLA